MIKEAYEKLQRLGSRKQVRHLFLMSKGIEHYTESGFDKRYTIDPEKYIGAFNKTISYTDFEAEVQAALDEIEIGEKYIDEIEARVGNGCDPWLRHSCGVPYRWDIDDLPTQKEVRKLKSIAPVLDYGRKSFQTA